MLSTRDIAILLKLIALGENNLTQVKLAVSLGLSQSEVSAGLARLVKSSLIHRLNAKPVVIKKACEEFFLYGFRYIYPLEKGAFTIGFPTSYAAPVFAGMFLNGDDPIPVWACAYGTAKGIAVEPLYPNLPMALHEFPDEKFYALLAVVDSLRQNKVRDRAIAGELFVALLRDNHANSASQ
jgi:hypothetical protein